MKKKRLLLSILPFLFLAACKPGGKENVHVTSKNIVTIKVPYDKKTAGNFEDYFSTVKYVPLETNSQSLLGEIDRLAFFDGKIYVLCTDINSVFIFDNNGKYLNKIQSVGKGPHEYNSLMDFAIDREDGRLILYSDRPYQFFFYDLMGSYIKSAPLNRLALNIGFMNNKILFRGTGKNGILNETTGDGHKPKTLLRPDPKDLFFNQFSTSYPTFTTDTKLNILFPYSDTVYAYDGDHLKASFALDFGDKSLNTLDCENLEYIDIYNKADELNLGFPNYNFRETENHVVFSSGGFRMVIYSKLTQQAKAYSIFIKEGDPIFFEDYFAHDGAGNCLVSICPAIKFINKTKQALENDPSLKLPDNVQQTLSEISELSNPVLMVYTFK